MGTNYSIGSSQAHNDLPAEQSGQVVGVAKFTAQEWDDSGKKVLANHSVELKVRFHPSSKTWEVVALKEWEGRF